VLETSAARVDGNWPVGTIAEPYRTVSRVD
jgi:hypothetical protein